MFDWNRITFLESTGNLKPLLRACTGRTPSTALAREVAVCLQQGRLLFQSAEGSAPEIRPLLLFYGTMAFAKALVVSRSLLPLATMLHSHGITDVSEPRARVTELVVRIGEAGTFQQFNDVVAQLNRLHYYDAESMPQTLMLPAAPSSQLQGMDLTLKEILSRIPGLERLYRRTFREPAQTDALSLHLSSRDPSYWELRIDDPEIFSDRSSLIALVQSWCHRYPVLAKWRVVRATRAWGNSIILFGNVAVAQNEFDDAVLEYQRAEFSATDEPWLNPSIARLPVEGLLSPPGGSFTVGTSLIAPLRGEYISEYSLHYLGMFLLSSLVRYRPQTWVHAISRTATAESPADDQALALLEGFMGIHAGLISGMLADVLNPER